MKALIIDKVATALDWIMRNPDTNTFNDDEDGDDGDTDFSECVNTFDLEEEDDDEDSDY